VAAAKAIRTGGDADLLGRLAGDKRVGLGKKKLQEILRQNERFVGAAPHQVDAFVATVQPLGKKHKGAVDYRPAKLL
jgi:adenylosuccinate lyase